MKAFRVAMQRLAGVFRRRQLDERLQQELAFHADMLAREHQAAGLGEAAAQRAARLRLAPGGAFDPLRESYRARGGMPLLEALGQDLRYAGRTMRKGPVFTAVALLSLALGIGTNSAIFSLVDALLLRGLPVPDADRLMVLKKDTGDSRQELFSYSGFRILQDASAACSGVMAVTDEFTALVRPVGGRAAAGALPSGAGGVGGVAAGGGDTFGSGAAETASAQLVSGNLFAVLGVRAALGRAFTPAEDVSPGTHPVAVISHGYWQRRFGGDPRVVGEALQIGGGGVVNIIGVLPRGFRGVLADEAPDIFLPVMLRDTVRYHGSMHTDGPSDAKAPVWNQSNEHWLNLLAKRRAGVSAARARAVLAVVYQRELQLELQGRTDPDDRKSVLAERLVVEPGARGLSFRRDTYGRPLLLLLALAALVLLIACTNVATLLMARADQRRRELAVRLGIGAGRARIVRQLLTESLLLAGLGGALGLLLASWGSPLLLRLVSTDLSDPLRLDVDLDWRKTTFAIVVAAVTGLVFGVAPALIGTRLDLSVALRQGDRSMKGAVRRGHRLPLGRVLVAAQVGLSLVLLVGAGLFVRSLQNLMRVDTGYAPGGLVTARIDPYLLGYDDARLEVLFQRLVERLEAIPGVRSASLSRARLLTNSTSTSDISLPGYTPRPHENMDVQQNLVSSDYFATVGLQPVAGRVFSRRDRAGAPRVAVINQTAARRFWPNVAPVGRRFGFGDDSKGIEVIGVVRDAKYHHLGEKTPPLVYQAVEQAAGRSELGFERDIEMRVDASAGDAAAAFAATQLRRAVAEVEPAMPVLNITTMTDQMAHSLARESAVARLTGFFGLLALLLAAIGLYGVMSYGVSRRTGELGLRLALGAQRSGVLALVVRETLELLAIGLAAGLVATWVLASLASSQLFRVSPHDPATIAGAVLVLVLVALVAGFVPARRAAATEPMQALRYE